jgi:Ser/Thr protein kinase RdoA (MazF antagonist)
VNASHPRRMADWWTDDPSNPGRLSPSDHAVRQVIAEIDPSSPITDIGGTMSLNVRIDRAGLVLRVHQPFVSRQRLLALQAVRFDLARQGLVVPVPRTLHGSMVFRCGDRWAEIENFIPHEQPKPTPASYQWLFGAMGRMHHALLPFDAKVPRPLVSTYAPPGSLRRWLHVAESAVQGDAGARNIIHQVRGLLGRLRTRWIPAARLPAQLVHGDMRLGNLCRSADRATVYLDFGFLAFRPRIHDLAYSLAFMLLALDEARDPSQTWLRSVPRLIEIYESAAGMPLTSLERETLAAYTAAVPMYFLSLAGFNRDPIGQLHAYRPFLGVTEWLLMHAHTG